MKIKDKMSRQVVTVGPRKCLRDALEIMRDYNFRRLPVVDNGVLVGMLVQHDIEIALRKPGIIPETPVEWVMSKNPLTVSPEDDIVFAALLLKDNKISGLPVMDGDKLVGIITDTDILQAFIEVMQNE